MNDRANIFYVLLTSYLLIAQLFAAYFWFIYAQNHGFLSTLFIGPIVGEIKGLLFPFFI
jgi:hypothetical protein